MSISCFFEPTLVDLCGIATKVTSSLASLFRPENCVHLLFTVYSLDTFQPKTRGLVLKPVFKLQPCCLFVAVTFVSCKRWQVVVK